MKICEGCNSTVRPDSKVHLCLVYLIKDELGGCPCMNCLIKVICSEQCSERLKYFCEVTKIYPEELENARHIRRKLLK